MTFLALKIRKELRGIWHDDGCYLYLTCDKCHYISILLLCIEFHVPAGFFAVESDKMQQIKYFH
jgi:hypothetical protein